jgi:hypothetical protein
MGNLVGAMQLQLKCIEQHNRAPETSMEPDSPAMTSSFRFQWVIVGGVLETDYSCHILGPQRVQLQWSGPSPLINPI